MKKRLSKLALLAIAAAFIVAGFPACSDEEEPDPPAQATATFTGEDIPEAGLALTAGEPKDDVTATLTVANTAFSDAVKDLEAGAPLADYITLSAGEKVSVVATLKEKVDGNIMKITLTVTADADAAAGDGTISATLKAAALTAAKDVEATGAISYTVKAADPDAPKATFVGDNIPTEGVSLAVGEEKTGDATITVTNTTFSDEVKALNEGDTIPDTLLTLNAGGKVTVTSVKVAAKANDTTVKITLAVTAGDSTGTGAIKATLKAAALTTENDVTASGNIAYTVKDDSTSENPPASEAGTFTLTEASATISLGKKNVGTIASNPNAGGKDYLSVASDNWNTSATVGEFTDEFYNLSGSSRSLTLTVKNVAGFKLYVKSSNADRTFTVKIGDGDTVTITHPGKQVIDETETDVIPFIFNTGTTDKVAIVLGGGSGSVYPAYVVVYDSAQDIPVEKVEITGIPSSAVLLAEGTVQLGATVSPDRATNKSLTWTSSDNDIATVDNNGLVTLKAAGTVTITAKTTNRKDEAEIIIQAAAVAVTGITLNKEATTITRWGTETLKATILPEEASDKTVEWTSSDENVAQVKDGVVSAIAAGTATVTAKSAANSAISVTCEVTITPAIVSKNFAIDKDDYNSTALTGKLLSNNMYTTAKVDSNGIYCHRKISVNGYTQFELDSPKIVTITYNVSSTKESGLVISTSDGNFSVPEGSSVKIAGETGNKALDDVLGTADSGSDTNTKAAYTSVTGTSNSKTDYSYLIQLTAGTYKLYGSTTNTSAKASSIVFAEPAS